MARDIRPRSTHRTGRASASRPGSNATAGSHWSHGSAGFRYDGNGTRSSSTASRSRVIIRRKELVTRLLADRARSVPARTALGAPRPPASPSLGQSGTAAARVGGPHGTGAAQDPGGLPTCHDAIHPGNPTALGSSHRRATCGESRMRRSGWGPSEKDPSRGHLADGPPVPFVAPTPNSAPPAARPARRPRTHRARLPRGTRHRMTRTAPRQEGTPVTDRTVVLTPKWYTTAQVARAARSLRALQDQDAHRSPR